MFSDGEWCLVMMNDVICLGMMSIVLECCLVTVMMCRDGEWCLRTGNSVYYCWLMSSDDVVWWIIIVNDVWLEMVTCDREW